jgi:hypothetical protein
MAPERDPDVLRALGVALANLPADSVAIENIGPAFRIARAPCQIVLRAPAWVRFAKTELLNPFCSEDSWVGLAAALGKTNHPPEKEKADLDFDGMGALKDDDDDEGKSKPVEAEPLRVNFNALSQALADVRPKDAFGSWEIAAGLLLFSGLLCLAISRSRHA